MNRHEHESPDIGRFNGREMRRGGWGGMPGGRGLFACHIFLRQDAELGTEALGEVAAGGEAHLRGHFRDATAATKEVGGALQALGLEEINGSLVCQRLDLAIEATATHVHLLRQDIDGKFLVAQVLLDEFLEAEHEFLVLLVHSELTQRFL